MSDDVYTSQPISKEHSKRYIMIVVNNVHGMLNRICSMFRRKRYFIEEISVTYDEEGKSYILIAVDGELLSVQQAISHLQKMHDVLEVYDATHKRSKLYNSFFVSAKTGKEDEFSDFPATLTRTIEDDEGLHGLFTVDLDATVELEKHLKQNNYHYKRRFLTFI